MDSEPADPDFLADVLAVAVTAAKAGGEQLMARWGDRAGVQEKGTSNNLVSDADRASEQAITELLVASRPDDAIVGEEGTARVGSGPVRWLVDPLDGTTSYLYGLRHWSVSIAAEISRGDGWHAIVGVVHDPAVGETFTATEGAGAWLGGHRLQVSDPVTLERALVATGFGYSAESRRRQATTVAHVLTRVRDIRRLGSAALELSSVAAGRVDAFYEDDLEPWDSAAGALIAAEAGALVTPFGDGVLAAGPGLHAALRAELDAAGAGQTG